MPNQDRGDKQDEEKRWQKYPDGSRPTRPRGLKVISDPSAIYSKWEGTWQRSVQPANFAAS